MSVHGFFVANRLLEQIICHILWFLALQSEVSTFAGRLSKPEVLMEGD